MYNNIFAQCHCHIVKNIISDFLAITVPRSRFLPVKSTRDLLLVMSDLYEIGKDYSLCLRPDRPISYQPVVKLSPHFNAISEFTRRFATIPHLRELMRLCIDGDIVFGRNVVLKVCFLNIEKKENAKNKKFGRL